MDFKFLYNDEINLHQLSILQNGYCSMCGKRILERTKVYAGKCKDGSYAVACEKCKDCIEKNKKNYVYYRNETNIPPKETKLWRYQDFSKFVSLIDSKKLYFTRADSFDDPFECARGYNFQKEDIYANDENFFLLKGRNQLNESGKNTPTDVEINKASLEEREAFIKQQEEKRKSYFVSCWHANDRESDGMWRLYASTYTQGIAVQTTVERLCRSLGNDCFEIGKVSYISFDRPLEVTKTPVWYKRDCFEYEKELRVVIKEIDNLDKGKLIDVDLDTLIESIYISPTATPWLADLVKNIMLKYGLQKSIVKSKLNEKPVF